MRAHYCESLLAFVLVLIVSHAALALGNSDASSSLSSAEFAKRSSVDQQVEKRSNRSGSNQSLPQDQRPAGRADASRDWKADKKSAGAASTDAGTQASGGASDKSRTTGSDKSTSATWRPKRRSLSGTPTLSEFVRRSPSSGDKGKSPSGVGPRPRPPITVTVPQPDYFTVTQKGDESPARPRGSKQKRSFDASRAWGAAQEVVALVKRSGYKPPGRRQQDSASSWKSSSSSASTSSDNAGSGSASWKSSGSGGHQPTSSYNAAMDMKKAPAKYPVKDPNHDVNSASSWRHRRRSLQEDKKGAITQKPAISDKSAPRNAALDPSNDRAVHISYKSPVSSIIGTPSPNNHAQQQSRRPPVKRSISAVVEHDRDSGAIGMAKRSSSRYKSKNGTDKSFSEATSGSYDARSHERFPQLSGGSSFSPSSHDKVHVSDSPRPPAGVGVIGDRRKKS